MTDNSAAEMTLQGWISGLRSLATDGPGALAQRVSVLVENDLRENIAANRGADGDAWEPRRKDGARALVNAMDHITVEPVKNSVVVQIRDGLVFSQWGSKHQVRRAIVPTKGFPKKLGNAIRLDFAEMNQEFLKRGGRHDRGGSGVRWTGGSRNG